MIRIIILARLGILFSSTQPLQPQLYFISETLLFTLISHCFYWIVVLDNPTVWSSIIYWIIQLSDRLLSLRFCEVLKIYNANCTLYTASIVQWYIVRWCIVRYWIVCVLLTMIHEDWGMDFPPYTFRRIYVPPPPLLLAEVLKSNRYN